LGTIPTPAQLVIGSIVNQLPLGLCNTICTNVRGPEATLYLLGHKMLRCYPYVPIGGDIGINCAVLTYDGTAYFGFTGDAHAAPDLGRLEKYLTTSFAALRKSVGGRTRPPKRGPSKAKQSTAAESSSPASPAPKQPDPSPVVRMPGQASSVGLTPKDKESEFHPGVAV
jgi:diacylglycerol O-acyltransferase